MSKPWYKKFKVLCAIATIIVEIAILVGSEILGKPITPETLMIMKYIFALGITVITGHTITDALANIKK